MSKQTEAVGLFHKDVIKWKGKGVCFVVSSSRIFKLVKSKKLIHLSNGVTFSRYESHVIVK